MSEAEASFRQMSLARALVYPAGPLAAVLAVTVSVGAGTLLLELNPKAPAQEILDAQAPANGRRKSSPFLAALRPDPETHAAIAVSARRAGDEGRVRPAPEFRSALTTSLRVTNFGIDMARWFIIPLFRSYFVRCPSGKIKRVFWNADSAFPLAIPGVEAKLSAGIDTDLLQNSTLGAEYKKKADTLLFQLDELSGDLPLLFRGASADTVSCTRPIPANTAKS